MRSALAAFVVGAVAAFALITFALPLVVERGHAQSSASQPGGPQASATPASTAGAQPSARDFALAAAIANKFEVIEGQLAIAQATDPALRAFAEVMVKDHTAALEAFKEAVRAGGVDLPAEIAPDAAHLARINAVKNRRGPDFDQAYRADQVQGHQQAAALLDAYARTGDNGALRSWATKTLVVVRTHQQLLQSRPAAASAK